MTEPLSPSFEELCELAAEYTMVPVWRELLADLETPVAAYAKLVGDGHGFLLESVEGSERWSRFSFIGRHPAARLVARGNEVVVHGKLPVDIPTDAGMLAAVEVLLETCKSPRIDELPPLQGGLVGYLGYDVVREIESLPDAPVDEQGYPDAVLELIGQLIAFDHWQQRLYVIESLPAGPLLAESQDALREAYDAAAVRIESAVTELGQPLPYVPSPPPSKAAELPSVKRSMSSEHYQSAVSVAKEYIRQGDIFQVVLAQRFEFDLEADPYDFYRVLRQINPSPYMYYLNLEEVTVAGSSPEPMVQLLGGRVISRPIAGTRPRGDTEEQDRQLGAELREHPKEVAEHVMLVDLARNDVGRVVKFGTRVVDELMSLERYSHVMHLTSQVSGELKQGLGPIDVIRATLPAGTVSGAPKVRAMQLIDELEPVRRGPYAGVVGYIDFSGNIDTAIAIRTMFVSNGRASVQAGAGVVADSDPAAEDEECWNKARALLSAVQGARDLTAKAANSSQNR